MQEPEAKLDSWVMREGGRLEIQVGRKEYQVQQNCADGLADIFFYLYFGLGETVIRIHRFEAR
jgi:hypothetical protein